MYTSTDATTWENNIIVHFNGCQDTEQQHKCTLQSLPENGQTTTNVHFNRCQNMENQHKCTLRSLPEHGKTIKCTLQWMAGHEKT